jgi:L-malate glycosyltransferase
LRRTTAWALTQADLVTAASKELERAALDLTSGKARPRVFQYGLDLRVWGYRERGAASQPVRIVSTRALGALYDVKTLIQATPIVRRSLPQIEVIVCGEGPQRSELERLAVELGVSDVVSFLGPQSEEALAATLREADVYVSTSLSDGLSLSLLEAMAAGLYPVVSDISANRALISDGANGLLFAPTSAESLATALIDAARRGDDHLRARRQNRDYVEQHADRSIILGGFEHCYYELTGRQSA